MTIDNASYQLILKQVEALLSTEKDLIANMANISALLFNNLEDINWAGFYIHRQGELVLGPFQGQVACTRIPIGKGVCGTAFAKNETTVVDDVHQFDGHIACDAASQSEIVVPFKVAEVQGVLDIDSPICERLKEDEKQFFEAVISMLENSV